LPQVTYPVAISPKYVSVADLNNDGHEDLVVADAYSGISVLLGNGDGTFQSELLTTNDYGATSVVALDLNGDGVIDVAAGNGFAVGVFLGHGDGTFDTPVYYTAGRSPEFIAAGDVNLDGVPDLISDVTDLLYHVEC
jgi:hypothetical protein